MLERLLVVAVVVLVVTLVGRLASRRDGRVTPVASPADRVVLDRATQSRLGLDDTHRGPRAVLFGSPTCAPCVTVKGVLDEIRAERQDFAWSYVDTADHLDVADEHRIRRVPTLLVLDEQGAVIARSSGVPARQELLETLATAA